MTTLRENLNTRKRRIYSVIFVGVALCVAGVFVGVESRNPPWLFLAGFAMAFGAAVYGYATIRCPSCKTRIGYYIMYGGSPFAIPRNMKYCPSCGVSLE